MWPVLSFVDVIFQSILTFRLFNCSLNLDFLLTTVLFTQEFCKHLHEPGENGYQRETLQLL